MIRVLRNPHPFKVGDVVRLRCGGFPMVVTRARRWVLTCAWQKLDGPAQEARYPWQAVAYVEQEPRP